MPSVRFQAKTASPEKLQAEVQRLSRDEKPVVLLNAFATPFFVFQSLLKDPTTLIASIKSIGNPFQIWQKYSAILHQRAQYNLTKDGRYLNAYLPYRASIQNNPKKLQEYEALVQKILQGMTLHGSSQRIESLTLKTIFTLWKDPQFRKLLKQQFQQILKPDKTPKPPQQLRSTLVKLGRKIKPEQLFRGRFPWQDPSTRYYIAASIADILHNRPDLIQKTFPKRQAFSVCGH